MDGADELGAAIKQHGSAVHGIALRILADPQRAEEVAQDVFLQLWRGKRLFASEEHLRRSLRRAAVHRAVDALRRAEPWTKQAEVDPDTLPFAEERYGVPDGLSFRLGSLVASLPPAMRTALVLRYGEDELAPEEIAALLGQPTATIKSNLARGLALLRRKAPQMLKEYVRVSER